MAKIQLLQERKGGSDVDLSPVGSPLGTVVYHFGPEHEGGPHLCDVKNSDHIATLLAIKEGYRLVLDEPGPGPSPLQPPSQSQPAPLDGAGEAQGETGSPQPQPTDAASGPADGVGKNGETAENPLEPIPENWRKLPWPQRRALADKLSDKPVNTNQDVERVISAEEARRKAATAAAAPAQ